MRVLLDTSILLWWQTNSPRLSQTARQNILTASAVVVSSVSLWEIAIKYAVGKLPVSASQAQNIARQDGFLSLPFTDAHALAVAELPPIHKDPFDRALVAQAASEPLILLTADPLVAQYGGTVRLV